jgi:hypothetical protein
MMDLVDLLEKAEFISIFYATILYEPMITEP